MVPGPRGALEIYEDSGYLCFCFAANRLMMQGAMHRDRPLDFRFEYLRLMTAALAAHPAPSRVLALGLGAGALPRLTRALLPEAEIDVVEIDPVVVSIARDHFDLGDDDDPRLRVHTADARDFVTAHLAGGGWDVVFVDCYDPVSVPAHLANIGFLRAVSRAAGAGAIIVTNLVCTHPGYEGLRRGWRRVLGQAWMLPALRRTNRVVFGPTVGALQIAPMLSRARALDAPRRLPFALGDCLARATPMTD